MVIVWETLTAHHPQVLRLKKKTSVLKQEESGNIDLQTSEECLLTHSLVYSPYVCCMERNEMVRKPKCQIKVVPPFFPPSQ